MQIVLPSTDIAHEVAARLAAHFKLPLPKAREWAAQLLGYPLWDALCERCHPTRADLSAPDRQCAPLAIRWRRAFQSERLADLAYLDVGEAARIIEEIRPSDGFEYTDLVLGRVPRQADPLLTLDDHRHLVAALDVLWAIGAREPAIERSLKRLRLSLEALLIQEYPVEQYPYDETREPYRAAAMFDRPKRTPKSLRPDKHQACRESLDSIQQVLDRLGPGDLTHTVDEIRSVVGQVGNQIDEWRRLSLSHDGKPTQWRGVSFDEEAMVQALVAVLPPELTAVFDSSEGIGLVSDEEAGLMLSHLSTAGIDGAGQPLLRKGIFRLQAIVRGSARAERRRWERFTPIPTEWILAAVDNDQRTLLGKVIADSSAAALAHGALTSTSGRLVATTPALAKKILGCSDAVLDALRLLA